MMTVTQQLLNQLLNPVELALEAVKVGNLKLLKILMAPHYQLQRVAQKNINQLEECDYRLQHLYRLREIYKTILTTLQKTWVEFSKPTRDKKTFDSASLNQHIGKALKDVKKNLLEHINLSLEKLDWVIVGGRRLKMNPTLLALLKTHYLQLINQDLTSKHWGNYPSLKSIKGACLDIANLLSVLEKNYDEACLEKSYLEIDLQNTMSELQVKRLKNIEKLVNVLRPTLKKLHISEGDVIACWSAAAVELSGTLANGETYSLVTQAIYSRRKKVLGFLKACGANLQEILEQAIVRGDIVLVKNLLLLVKFSLPIKQGFLNHCDEAGNTVMHLAVREAMQSKDDSLVIYLVQQGGNVFQCNQQLETPWQLLLDYIPITQDGIRQHIKCLREIEKQFKHEDLLASTERTVPYAVRVIERLQRQQCYLMKVMTEKNAPEPKYLAQQQFTLVNELLIALGNNPEDLPDEMAISRMLHHNAAHTTRIINYQNLLSDLFLLSTFAETPWHELKTEKKLKELQDLQEATKQQQLAFEAQMEVYKRRALEAEEKLQQSLQENSQTYLQREEESMSSSSSTVPTDFFKNKSTGVTQSTLTLQPAT